MATFAFVFGGGEDSFQDRIRIVMKSLKPPVTLLPEVHGARGGLQHRKGDAGSWGPS
jgi:hypothetical protein